MHYARGKCLGGTTARNYLVYQRGTVASYQNWADQVGDQSYTFDRLLPFFKKTTKFTPPNMDIRFANATPEYNETVLGNDGPVSISYTNYAQAFATWTTEGLLAMGIPIIKGFQAGSLLGQSYTMLAINPTTMTRVSSETSFMRKALEYPNLTVYQSTMAKRVLFNANKKATGVLVDTQGKKFTLTATKEVIISAGVFGSPHLLLVSGVGPAATLEEFEIPVIADLPGVGQNMQDHIYFGPSYRVNAPTMSSLQNPDFAADAAREFNEKAAGMYANPTVDTLGWEKIPEPLRSSTFSAETRFVLDQYPADWPEVEYFSLSTYLGYQYKSRGGDPNDGYNYASLGAAIAMPRSRGNITITSADNAVHPVINPNFLSDRADIEVSIAAFKRLRQFWNSTALEPFLADPNESFPGLNVSTDAQMEDIIRKSFNTVFHAACTCSMGPSADRLAVVDPQARVYGVQSLRIVDASIFPFLPPGHPMATVCELFP